MSALDELGDYVKSAMPGDDPAQTEIALRIAQDLFNLQAQQFLGKNVNSELVMLKATALNLTAETKSRLNNALRTWWRKKLDEAVDYLMPD